MPRSPSTKIQNVPARQIRVRDEVFSRKDGAYLGLVVDVATVDGDIVVTFISRNRHHFSPNHRVDVTRP